MPKYFTPHSCYIGSPRVDGDEEEEEFDDLDNEFEYGGNDPQHFAEAGLSSRLSTGRGHQRNASGVTAPYEMESSPLNPDIPLLTYDQEVNWIDIGFN